MLSISNRIISKSSWFFFSFGLNWKYHSQNRNLVFFSVIKRMSVYILILIKVTYQKIYIFKEWQTTHIRKVVEIFQVSRRFSSCKAKKLTLLRCEYSLFFLWRNIFKIYAIHWKSSKIKIKMHRFRYAAN
jgi:hypothetical protein